jgi:hypothetical protein
MWKLTARAERGSPFPELSSFASIEMAARTIIKTENDPSLGTILFRVYIDPTCTLSEAGGPSRLGHQSAKRFYLRLEVSAQRWNRCPHSRARSPGQAGP